jgi:hypothetical protein
MTRAARAALHLVCAALACLWLGCESEGVIGTQAAAQTCADDCPAGKHCDPDLRQCVECAEDGECPEAAPFCEGFSCAECRQASDCPDDAPRCAAGSCGACREDSDCNGGRTDGGEPERHCEDGACVAEDEQETDDEHGQSGEAGEEAEEAGSGSEEE